MKKLFTIMSLVFFYSTSNLKAQNLFNQDFTPSNTLGDYFNATGAAAANQLDYISNLSNAPASVVDGVFSWNRDGNTSPAWIVRNTSFVSNPTFLKFQMRVRFTPPVNFLASPTGSSFLCIGDGTSGNWAFKNTGGGAAPTAAESFARVDFLYNVSAGGVSFRAGGSTTLFNGWQDITMFCNKTAGTMSYVGPDNVATTVNSGSSDLWIGTTKVRANVVSTSSVDLKKFKIVFPSTLQNMNIDIDYIKVWDESVLPVKFIDFKAENKSGYNKLSWSTASETNNSHFNIYNSVDGKAFNLLTTVKGNGSTNSVSNYTYADRLISANDTYYKLEQVDFDGRTEELKTIFLKSSFATVNYAVHVKDDKVEIFSTANNLSKVENVKVYNISGSKLVDQVVNSTDKISIAKNFEKGVYLLQLLLKDGRTEVLKFVK